MNNQESELIPQLGTILHELVRQKFKVCNHQVYVRMWISGTFISC